MNPHTHHSQSKKIKPLQTPQRVALQSLRTYQDFLRRRPKNTVAIKFSWKYVYSKFLRGFAQKAQAQLLEALKLSKYLKKVDLTGFQVNEFDFNQTLSESIYKKIAKVKSLSVGRIAYFPHEKKPFTDKWLKYFTLLENLNYGLTVDANFVPDENLIILPKSNDPLGHLKYCPKIQSLNLDTAGASRNFRQVFIKFDYFPTSLKHLSIKSSLDPHELKLPLAKLGQLRSINICPPTDNFIHYMNALSDLPLLENLEIIIHTLGDLESEFLAIWRRITAKKQLKRLHLGLGSNCPNIQEVFNALQDCFQLTHISLHLHETNPHLLSIAHCLRNKPQLQSLQLRIFSSSSFNHAIGFGEMCSQIIYLEALRHLQLSLFSQETEKVPHFISYFQRIFEKPIKLETLDLSCSQADPEIMIKELISGLQYSGSSLRKLRVNQPCPPGDISLIKLLPSLENITEIELPTLKIIDPNALNDVVRAVETLKNLRVFEIGEIGGTIMKSEYVDGIERILKKKGLRKFVWQTEEYMTNENIRFDAKGILRENPFLEVAGMTYGSLDRDIYTWIKRISL